MNVWGTTKKILGLGLLCLPLTMTTTLTGCLTDDKEDTTKTDTVKHTALSAEKTLSVGAQAATLGSVMDLDATTDAAMVLNSAAANAAQATIDLVFMYYGGGFHMDNAVEARTAGIANSINLTNSYDLTKIQDIRIVKVTTKPADQEAAKAASAAGTAIKGSVITGGEMFIVTTTGGKIALVTVGSIVGTDNKANGSFKVSINTI